MTYFIIAIVLLMIIAPIVAVLPSKGQKARMTLRQAAMRDGISVELTQIEDPIPKQDKYISPTGRPLEPLLKVAAYRLARQKPLEWRKTPRLDWCIRRCAEASTNSLPGTWDWRDQEPDGLNTAFLQFLAERVAQLPGDVVQIEEHNFMLTVFWREASGDEGLSSVVSFLKDGVAIELVEPGDDSDLD